MHRMKNLLEAFDSVIIMSYENELLCFSTSTTKLYLYKYLQSIHNKLFPSY